MHHEKYSSLGDKLLSPAVISIWSMHQEKNSSFGDKLSSPGNKQQSGYIMVSRWAFFEGVKWKLVRSKFILEAGSHSYIEYASREKFLSRG
jgi:hypothetical protein